MNTQPLPERSESLSIPESVQPLRDYITEQNRNQALTPFRSGVMVEMPCCGFMFDATAIDCVPDVPSTIYWPPRWTCPSCNRTFSPCAFTSHLEELGVDDEQ